VTRDARAAQGRAETTVVVPTVGRPSLHTLLRALADGTEVPTAPVIVVDDQRDDHLASSDLGTVLRDLEPLRVRVLRTGGRGPAAARNLGWRHARTPWVSFLDDDVVPEKERYAALLADLAAAGPHVAGIQGRLTVPLPRDRRPTDWERTTAGLESARWITADLTYRRRALAAVGGFDERFPRAYREDADLGLRVTATQGEIVKGRRRVSHPVRPADDWVSIRQQAGNADDVLMRRLHGPSWRERAGAPRGRLQRHLAAVGAASVATAAALTNHRRLAGVAAAGWLALTADFSRSRIAPGPRDSREVRRMLVTSALLPFAAAWHAARGRLVHRNVRPWRGVPELVLFDRDGTLVVDVPYNADPEAVQPVNGAVGALNQLRRNGIRVGVVTNQSAVGRGRISVEELAAVNGRIDELLGPFDVWQQCLHAPEDGCTCRKPAPGLVREACDALGVSPGRVVVVGDIGSDVDAARAAGAVGVLVPTAVTRRAEVEAAGHVCADLSAAVDDVLGGRW